MKRLSKMLVAILALIFLFPTTVLAANERNGNNIMNGDGDTSIPLSYEERIAQIDEDNSLTEAQKEAQKEKMMFGEQVNQIELDSTLSRSAKDSRINALNASFFGASNQISPFAAEHISLIVPYFKQETNYYCGPATARQTISSIKGALTGTGVPSQSAIANDPAFGGVTSGGGTLNATKMRQYINSKAGVNYVEVVNYTASAMQMCIDRGMETYKMPPILRMKNASGNSSWLYTTDGHYCNISAKINSTTYQITDPYIKWAYPDGNIYYTGKYNRTLDQIYNVTQQHSAKSFWF